MKNLSHTLLSHKDEIELFKAYEIAETRQEAYEKIILHNQRLVMSVAARYKNIALDDAFQDGNLGLIEGIKRFDYRRGTRFSTYATWWIRQSVTRELAQKSRTIRIPMHEFEEIRRMYRTARRLEQELGRTPTIKDLAEELEPTEELEIARQRIVRMIKESMDMISLETPMGEDEDSVLGDFIEDETSLDPFEATASSTLKEAVKTALYGLNPRERIILNLRFGLEDGEEHTLEEIANKFGLSRERIRQLEKRALKCLRHPHLSRPLRNWR